LAGNVSLLVVWWVLRIITVLGCVFRLIFVLGIDATQLCFWLILRLNFIFGSCSTSALFSVRVEAYPLFGGCEA